MKAAVLIRLLEITTTLHIPGWDPFEAVFGRDLMDEDFNGYSVPVEK